MKKLLLLFISFVVIVGAFEALSKTPRISKKEREERERSFGPRIETFEARKGFVIDSVFADNLIQAFVENHDMSQVKVKEFLIAFYSVKDHKPVHWNPDYNTYFWIMYCDYRAPSIIVPYKGWNIALGGTEITEDDPRSQFFGLTDSMIKAQYEYFWDPFTGSTYYEYKDGNIKRLTPFDEAQYLLTQ